MFIGHTYNWEQSNTIDPRLERLNFDHCDGLWLGGDMCSATTEERRVLDYLDDYLLISRRTTLWALGNHDTNKGNIHFITEKTKKPTFYSQNDNGLTFLVIDNFLDKEELYGDRTCELLQQQVDLIQSVTDTIQYSSHLIMMMHMVTWGGSEPGMDTQNHANANAPWWRFTCDDASRFHQIIYPMLRKVKERGIEVLILSGDGGANSKGYHFEAMNGIHFFISGINNSIAKDRWKDLPQFNFEPDSVLLFEHRPNARTLEWKFKELNELVE